MPITSTSLSFSFCQSTSLPSFFLPRPDVCLAVSTVCLLSALLMSVVCPLSAVCLLCGHCDMWSADQVLGIATAKAMSGGAFVISDDLGAVSPERMR